MDAASKCLQIIEWDRARINQVGRQVQSILEQQVIPRTQPQAMQSIKQQVMVNPPPQSVISAGNPTITNASHILTRRIIQRNTSKQMYADNIADHAINDTLASFSDLVPVEDRQPAFPQIRKDLKSSVAIAKTCALDVITRYESIVDGAGCNDNARYLSLQEHGWMNAFLIYTIHKATARGAKKLRKKMQDAKVCHGEAVNVEEPTSEQEIAEIMTNLTKGINLRAPSPRMD